MNERDQFIADNLDKPEYRERWPHFTDRKNKLGAIFDRGGEIPEDPEPTGITTETITEDVPPIASETDDGED